MSENRDQRIHIRVSEEEKKQLEAASSQFGTKSVSAFIRKMAIDGLIINLQMPELSDMVSLQRRCASSMNQIAKKVNATGRIYESDLGQIHHDLEEIWQAANNILAKLSAIK